MCGAGSNASFSQVDIWDKDKKYIFFNKSGHNITLIYFRIPDWRQISDIVLVAPKVHHISKHALGYTCPSGDSLKGLGLDLDFRILFNGYLEVNM